MDAEFFGYRSGAFTGQGPADQKAISGKPMAACSSSMKSAICRFPCRRNSCGRCRRGKSFRSAGGDRSGGFHAGLRDEQDLWELVQTGRFRSDLYFRIAQYTLALPSVRNRSDRVRLIDELWGTLGGRAKGIALSPECRNWLQL